MPVYPSTCTNVLSSTYVTVAPSHVLSISYLQIFCMVADFLLPVLSLISTLTRLPLARETCLFSLTPKWPANPKERLPKKSISTAFHNSAKPHPTTSIAHAHFTSRGPSPFNVGGDIKKRHRKKTREWGKTGARFSLLLRSLFGEKLLKSFIWRAGAALPWHGLEIRPGAPMVFVWLNSWNRAWWNTNSTRNSVKPVSSRVFSLGQSCRSDVYDWSGRKRIRLLLSVLMILSVVTTMISRSSHLTD